MVSAIEIARIVLPLLIVGGIAIFVVTRLKFNHQRGTLGKKKSTAAQSLLDSLIPLGMLIGCVIGMIISMIFSFTLSSAISLGAGIGLLVGYFAYEVYGKKEESNS